MSEPPPPPTDDAPLPPGSDGVTPAPQFQSMGAKKAPRSKGTKLGMIGGLVVLVGGLVFAGITYGPALWDKLFGGLPSSPDGTVKYVLNGVADNKPEAIWEVAPESHQKVINDSLKQLLAIVDPEVHQQLFAVLQKAVGILKSKKDMILSLAQSGPEGPGELGLLIDGYDDAVAALEVLVNGKLSDPEWIKNPDLGELLKDVGKLMANPMVEKLIDAELAGNPSGPNSLTALRSALRGVEVIVVTETDTEATLKMVSKELAPNQPESNEFKMFKVEDRWVPEGFEDTEKLKFGLSFLTESAGLEKMTPQQSGALIRFLKAVDGVLDTIDQSKNAEELVAAAMAGAAGLALTAETLKGAFPNFGGGGFGPGDAPPGGPPFAGGGNPTPLPGIGPGPGALPGIATTNPGALPGLTPQPKVPPGRTENWRINAGSKQRIDVIYMGKPTDTLKVAFGEPDAMEGPYWVYNGLKVRNIASGGTFTTVLFRIQAGKVTEVKAR